MTKTYIFDFGKVLVEYEPSYMTGKYIHDEEDKKIVMEVVFDRLYWDKLDAGTITHEEVKVQYRDRLPKRLWEQADEVFDNWFKHLPEIAGMKEILFDLKSKGCSLYLLSNISNYFVENYKKVPSLVDLFNMFDGLVFSAPLSMVKPNPEIFRYVLEKFELNPEDCTFIDDNSNNVDAAKALGMQGVVFCGDAKEVVLNKRLYNRGTYGIIQ